MKGVFQHAYMHAYLNNHTSGYPFLSKLRLSLRAHPQLSRDWLSPSMSNLAVAIGDRKFTIQLQTMKKGENIPMNPIYLVIHGSHHSKPYSILPLIFKHNTSTCEYRMILQTSLSLTVTHCHFHYHWRQSLFSLNLVCKPTVGTAGVYSAGVTSSCHAFTVFSHSSPIIHSQSKK